MVVGRRRVGMLKVGDSGGQRGGFFWGEGSVNV